MMAIQLSCWTSAAQLSGRELCAPALLRETLSRQAAKTHREIHLE